MRSRTHVSHLAEDTSDPCRRPIQTDRQGHAPYRGVQLSSGGDWRWGGPDLLNGQNVHAGQLTYYAVGCTVIRTSAPTKNINVILYGMQMFDMSVTPHNGKRILLLQSPVGRFFNELQSELLDSGYSVKRVLFNSGDSLFASARGCVRFTGTLDEWETWLRFEISENKTDCIIFFGSNRPAHKVARRLADLFDIYVLSLEEGYLRSGYVTVEQGGNNQHSPLIAWSPNGSQVSNEGVRHTANPMKSSYAAMSFWGATYYVARDIFSYSSDEELFHRPRERFFSLSWSWCTHMLRRATARITEAPLRRALHRNPGYIIVPLQVSNDSQIREAAREWTTPKLVDACLTALALSHPHQKVVFKLHPLERGNRKIKKMIRQRAQELKIGQTRYKIIHTGRIGDLTAHSSGMVLINSTSAFSALNHGMPLLVLGAAVFRHEEIATIGETQNDVIDFFRLRFAKSPEKIAAFFEAIKSQSLFPGDFYLSAGRREAIKNIIQKLDDMPVALSAAQRVVT